MKSLFTLLISTLIIAQAPVFANNGDTTPRKLLIGTWHHLHFKQFADEKLVREYDASDETTLEFKEDGTWAMNSVKSHSSGTYHWLDDTTIQTTIVQSNLPQQIGTTKGKQIQVTSTTLQMTTVYRDSEIPIRPNGTSPKKLVVISDFARADNK